MYDSGGISLKPTDADARGDEDGHVGRRGGAVVDVGAAGARLPDQPSPGYLMCTDNMPSGSAMKLGDVLTIHGGTTVEIHNTDAEGRLLLADGLALATSRQPDAIVDIATLTGACLVALGPAVAGRARQRPGVGRPGRRGVGAPPTSRCGSSRSRRQRYRKLLDSDIADLKNVGGPYGGAITAAVFLSEFVGDVPWAHLDIAGPMKVDADESWRSKGATGFGTRLLVDLASASAPR